VLLKDPETRGWLVWHLSDRIAYNETSFPGSLPRARERIEGFEDLTWLFAANVLTHGVSRLTFDEAAYLYRLVESRADPSVLEVGRFRGGTTFLLAAAGGHVLSIDIDEESQRVFGPELASALDRFGLASRVDLALGDSTTYPSDGRTFDVVFLDGAYTYEGMRADVEHWLPTLAPGGDLIVHSLDPEDVRVPVIGNRFAGLWRLLDELDADGELERVPGSPGAMAHYRAAKDRAGSSSQTRQGAAPEAH
jgi:predicted O-methyltransferase YrrM